MEPVKLPAITQAQVAVFLSAIAGTLTILVGLPDRLQLAALVGGVALGVAWLLSDAWIRHGRATGVGVEIAKAAVPVAALGGAPDGDDSSAARRGAAAGDVGMTGPSKRKTS